MIHKDDASPSLVVINQEEITICKNRASAHIIHWGSLPLGIDKNAHRGISYVPNGFTIETFSDSKWWIGQTMVTDDGEINYRFYLKGEKDPDKIGGDWCNNASRAYRNAYSKLIDVSIQTLEKLKKANGNLIIGITYPAIQERIHQLFTPAIINGLFRIPPSPRNKNKRLKRSFHHQ